MSGAAAIKPSKYELRREAALDAAASVFAQLGYHGASTGLIADRLGIRQGSLYYYFSSKEQALEEVCLKGVADFLIGLQDIAGSARGTEDKLRAAVLNHLHALIDRPDYVRTFINQRQLLSDASRRAVGQQVRRYESMILNLFATGVAERIFRSDLDCELAALGLIGECNAVFMWFGRRARARSLENIAEDIATRLLIGVKA